MMSISNKQIAFSEGCATCDDNIMWKSHSIQTQVSSCSYIVYYGVRSCPTNINEIKIDSIRAISSQGCNVNLVLQNAQKEILQSSLSLLNANPLGGTIRIKKYSCYNDSTYQNCDTNCSSTDYLISRNKNNDSVWYSISLVTNNSNNGACGILGGECTNKSNNYVSENTILSKFPISQSDNPNDFTNCSQDCFWTLHGNDNVTNINYMGSFNDQDVIFKRFASEKMRLGVEGLGILQQNPIEALHIGNYLNFHVGGNYHSLSFNEYYAGNGIRKRWENKFPEIPHLYTPQTNGLPQFSGALTFNTSSYNGDGAIELGTAGLGLKEETLNYNESNNLSGHNSGYKGLIIRPTPLNPINNYGLIGLGTYPSENTTRVLIKGMGNDNATAALNVTDNTGYSKLIVKDNGNVGIGTITPNDIFQVGDELTYTNYSKQFLFNAYVDYSVLPANPYKFINPTHLTNGNQTALVIGLGGAGKGADILVDQGTSSHNSTADLNYATPQGIRILPKGSVISITPEILAQGGLIGINNYYPTSTLHIKGAGNTNATSSLNIENTNGSILFVQDNGNVGIGTNAPTSKLFVKANGNTNSTSSLNILNSDNNPLLFVQDNGNVGINSTSPSAKLFIKTVGTTDATNSLTIEDNNSIPKTLFTVRDDGKVGIGSNSFKTDANGTNVKLLINGDVQVGSANLNTTTVTGFNNRLSVDGIIFTKEIRVTTANWADHVFSNSYNLKSIDALESFIIENKHLPNIPNEKEVKENGVSLNGMQVKLLEKIEELSLYLIELNKQNKQLLNRIETLERK